MPTNCMQFGKIKSRKVFANFEGGEITSDAGVLLLREANRKTGMIGDLAAAITDWRHPSYIDHSIETMLTQRIFGIACGYEDVNDHAELRNDPMFQIGANKLPGGDPLASAPTICRLENAVTITRETLLEMSRVPVELFIKSFKNAPKVITLDFDATDDQVHGRQECAFFNKFYDGDCFLPLYVFCNGQPLISYLRPSNRDGALHAGAILKLLVKRIRQAWPGVVIRWRADAGFCRPRILGWCERNQVEYFVGIPMNSRLQEAAEPVFSSSQLRVTWFQKTMQTFGWAEYQAAGWSRSRSVVVKIEEGPEGVIATRGVVTNSKEKDAAKIYKQLYAKRGDMENRIKEQQLDMFADRTSCSRFLSNQFRLLLSTAAYLLMEYIRRIRLTATEFAAAQCGTIRTKLLKIGAVIVTNTRRIEIFMAGRYPYKKAFFTAAGRARASG